MKVLIFDLSGKFAHFRKIYTNSSSLSYSIPPRTMLAGLIAALLGKERDSYYQQFNRQTVHIAVRKINRTRKIMQTVNYMKATGPKDILAPKEHTQIPFELVGSDFELKYRVYFASEDEILFEELKERLITEKYVFPPYFGSASFCAHIQYVDEVQAEAYSANDTINIKSPVPLISVTDISFKDMHTEVALVKELMPVDFTAERQPIDTGSYIYDENTGSLPVTINSDSRYWQIKYEYIGATILDNIMFY